MRCGPQPNSRQNQSYNEQEHHHSISKRDFVALTFSVFNTLYISPRIRSYNIGGSKNFLCLYPPKSSPKMEAIAWHTVSHGSFIINTSNRRLSLRPFFIFILVACLWISFLLLFPLPNVLGGNCVALHCVMSFSLRKQNHRIRGPYGRKRASERECVWFMMAFTIPLFWFIVRSLILGGGFCYRWI